MSDAARRVLIAIFWFGLAGTTIELLLLGHTEHLDQWIPLLVAAVALLMSIVAIVRPTAITIRSFQVVLLIMAASGALGMYYHFRANMEFQLEMDAALQGWALFRKAIVAKSPPALAPGSMTQLALIGLAYTFRHPALRRNS